MIDWVTAVLRCNHDPFKLMDGFVMSCDKNGNNEWVVNKNVTVGGLFLLRFKLNQ